MLRSTSLALITALALAPAAALAEPHPATVAAEHVQRSTPAPKASSTDASRYADREQQEPKAANFEGGNVIVISGGALIVCLLLLILIV